MNKKIILSFFFLTSLSSVQAFDWKGYAQNGWGKAIEYAKHSGVKLSEAGSHLVDYVKAHKKATLATAGFVGAYVAANALFLYVLKKRTEAATKIAHSMPLPVWDTISFNPKKGVWLWIPVKQFELDKLIGVQATINFILSRHVSFNESYLLTISGTKINMNLADLLYAKKELDRFIPTFKGVLKQKKAQEKNGVQRKIKRTKSLPSLSK